MTPLWPVLTLQASEISYLKLRVLDKDFPIAPAKPSSGLIERSGLCGWSVAIEMDLEKKASSPTSKGQEGWLMYLLASELELQASQGTQTGGGGAGSASGPAHAVPVTLFLLTAVIP